MKLVWTRNPLTRFCDMARRAAGHSLTLSTLAAVVVACAPAEPDVELDTPEAAAESVGRILCAEHEARVESVLDEMDRVRGIQSAKARVIADSDQLERANDRLIEFTKFVDEHEDELTECRVVLTDMDEVVADQKYNLSLDVVTTEWAVEDDSLVTNEVSRPVLLTLTLMKDEWRVTRMSVDISAPAGAFGRLIE